MSPKIGELALQKPIPVEVALLITEKTRDYVFRGGPSSFAGSANTFEFPLGQALETACLEAFSQVFKKVTLVRSRSEANAFPAYVEPAVEGFDIRIEMFSALVVRLTTRASVIQAGTTIWAHSESNETRSGKARSALEEWSETATENLEVSVRKLAVAMSEHPTVRRLTE